MKFDQHKKKLLWIGLGLLAALLRYGAGFQPQLVEQFYSRGLFLGIRWIIDYLIAWIPIPLIYVFFGIILFLFVRSMRNIFRDREKRFPAKLGSAFLNLLSFTGALLFFFLFLWGFNYTRVPVEKQLGLQPNPLTVEELFQELETETETLIRLRSEIPAITDSAFTANLIPEKLEKKVRQDLENWLGANGFPTVGRVRARKLFPKGIFMRFSSAGLYWPFTGEGNVDGGLHPVVFPFVFAHEMSHGYGFGDEGTCNFLAYLATSQSEDPVIAYSGQLDYWQTLAINCRRYDRERYAEFRKQIPQGIRSDIQAIYVNNQKYPDLIPRYRQLVIDPYLKSQGVKEGIKSYDRVIMLVKAWREKE